MDISIFSSQIHIGAVNVKLTDEEIKELEDSYVPQAAFGHS